MALLTRLPLLPSSRLHRSLFTFPDLSSLSPFSDSNGNNNQQPHTYHERKILPYRPSELYNVVADATSYPRFLPFCTDARILGNSKGVSAPHLQSNSMDVELTVGFLSFKERYVSKVTCRPHESVEAVACSSTPLFKTLNTVWRFQPASPKSPHPSFQLPRLTSVPAQVWSGVTSGKADAGPTLVTLDLSFAFANPVHAAVSATFFGQVSKMMVKAFEERCLEIYGPGKA